MPKFENTLWLISDTYWQTKKIERNAYKELTAAITAAERLGVPEVSMIETTGLARMTVRKYRKLAHIKTER